MGNGIFDRLKEYLRLKGDSVSGLEKKIGRGNAYFSGTKNWSPDTVKAVSDVYPELNIGWLFTGKGEMENRDQGIMASGSPYFDNFFVEGGAASGFGDESAIVPAGYMNIPGVPSSGGTFFIKVRGESMLNRNNPQRSIPEGSWVALRKVTTSSIQWGEVYAFMTTDGPVVKRIMPSDKDGCIKCVSFNEEGGYSPFDLPVREIIGGDFFIVTAVVNINIL